jgi:hypothetical protein
MVMLTGGPLIRSLLRSRSLIPLRLPISLDERDGTPPLLVDANRELDDVALLVRDKPAALVIPPVDDDDGALLRDELLPPPRLEPGADIPTWDDDR